jgi:hypothetical protein
MHRLSGLSVCLRYSRSAISSHSINNIFTSSIRHDLKSFTHTINQHRRTLPPRLPTRHSPSPTRPVRITSEHHTNAMASSHWDSTVISTSESTTSTDYSLATTCSDSAAVSQSEIAAAPHITESNLTGSAISSQSESIAVPHITVTTDAIYLTPTAIVLKVRWLVTCRQEVAGHSLTSLSFVYSYWLCYTVFT